MLQPCTSLHIQLFSLNGAKSRTMKVRDALFFLQNYSFPLGLSPPRTSCQDGVTVPTEFFPHHQIPLNRPLHHFTISSLSFLFSHLTIVSTCLSCLNRSLRLVEFFFQKPPVKISKFTQKEGRPVLGIIHLV